MFKRNLQILLFFFAALLIYNATEARAQDSVAASASLVTGAKVPRGGERLLPESVPAEFNRALDNILKQGGGEIAGGDREILAWTGDYKTAANVTKFVGQIQTNFRAAGWQYEAMGRDGGVEAFSLIKEGSPRRLVFGFFVPGDGVMVCALMEVVRAGGGGDSPGAQKTATPAGPANSKAPAADAGRPGDGAAGAVVLNVPRDAHFVNVMGNEMPAMPKFPALAPKPGRVRGYVKDFSGNPLRGATIGIRASYFAGMYSGAQGETDANGYYEFVVPKGSAHFYNAGYALEWGDGIAAVGLHPADGKLDSFTTADGTVENFVLLPYGVTSREKLSENPFVPSTYYGGSVRISYYTVEESDRGRIAGSIVENSVIEITLTPEGRMLDGTGGKTFHIRHTVGFKGNFDVHNIPLGRYRITARMGGKPLKMKEHRKFNPLFGLMPGEATGEAGLLFIPAGSKASGATPNFGGWDGVGITVSTP